MQLQFILDIDEIRKIVIVLDAVKLLAQITDKLCWELGVPVTTAFLRRCQL